MHTTADALYTSGNWMNGMDVRIQIRHTRVTLGAMAGDGRQDVEDGSEESRRQTPITSAASPFELTSARGWTADRRMQAPEHRAMEERTAYTDLRRTRTQEGLRMPSSLSFDRRDGLLVQPMVQGVRMPNVTATYNTRMTPRE